MTDALEWREPEPDEYWDSLTAEDIAEAFQVVDSEPRPAALPGLPDTLNDGQREAVLSTSGPLMVVAGPGSGKTKVLTERIVQLMREGADPSSILAISFTRKAAKEVRDRLAGMVGHDRADRVWGMTFHAFAGRVLRSEGHLIGLDPSYETLDSGDVAKLLRAIAKEYKIQMPKKAGPRISSAKRGVETTLQDRIQEMKSHDPDLGALWQEYEKRKRDLNRVDFDDMILLAHQVLQIPEVRDRWSRRFRHISVDEYQDTDQLQHAIVSALARTSDSFMVVGDLDQTVYSFRGASPEVLEYFTADFPGTKAVVLHDNYRSTPEILDAVRAVISPIPAKFRSRLLPHAPASVPALVRTYRTGRDEANQVAAAIRKLVAAGASPDEFGVLYRTQSQSHVLESALRKEGVPYELSGGMSFYERKPVKDALAWLRFAFLPADEWSFRRVADQVVGIGAKKVDELLVEARGSHDGDLLECLRAIVQAKTAAGKGAQKGVQALQHIVDRVERIRSESDKNGVRGAVYAATESTRAAADDAEDFYDLMTDLLEDAAAFVPESSAIPFAGMDVVHPVLGDATVTTYDMRLPEATVTATGGATVQVGTGSLMQVVCERREGVVTPVVEFMQTLTVDRARLEESEGASVTLSTVHAAKGREFDHVFVVGLEDRLFPVLGSSETKIVDGTERHDLPMAGSDEERRLCFVALSRARKSLVLSWAKRRSRFGGKPEPTKPSEYLYELEEAGVARFDRPLPPPGQSYGW